MSFYYFLEEIFGREKCVRFGNKKDIYEFHRNESKNYKLFKVVSGHVTVSDLKDRGLLDGERITIAFIRKPYEREISCFLHYFFSDHPDHIKLLSNDFFECVDNFFSNTKHISQESFLNLNYQTDDIHDFLTSSGIILLPMSLLGEVSTLIKNKFSLDYYVVKNNISSFDLLKRKKFILELYVNNFIKQHRENDLKLFDYVDRHAYSSVEILKGQLNNFIN